MTTNQDNKVARMIRAALKLQPRLIGRVPKEKRMQGEGRIGKFIVMDDQNGQQGPDYTVMYFQVKNGFLEEMKVPPPHVRNEVVFRGIEWKKGYTGVDLLLDIAEQRVSLRKAYTEGWLVITPAMMEAIASYDSEEMLQLAEDMLHLVGKYMMQESGR